MKKSKEQFMEQYIYYVLEMQKATFKGDYRTNNKYARKSTKLNKEYENEDYFSEVLSELIDNENLEIALTAAADSLRRNINIDKAVKILEETSIREENNILGLTSGIVLKKWKEKGAEGLK